MGTFYWVVEKLPVDITAHGSDNSHENDGGLHSTCAIEDWFPPYEQISEPQDDWDYANTDKEGLASGQHCHANIGRYDLENNDPVAKTLEVKADGEAEYRRVPFPRGRVCKLTQTEWEDEGHLHAEEQRSLGLWKPWKVT